MKILGHIHTFNDEEVIDRSLHALLDQTYPLDEIVLVDNASTDGTLQRNFPSKVTIIRHTENSGTSGAVATGLQYGIAHHYDFAWILDADCVAEKDALEKLVALYESFPIELKAQVWRLSSLPMEHPKWAAWEYSLRSARFAGNTIPQPRHGIVFTSRGSTRVAPITGQPVYECDGTIWSGNLFKLSAVEKIGLPNPDYVLDWGEYEYGYIGKSAGYRAFMHQSSLLQHNITGISTASFTTYRVGPVAFNMLEMPPIRCYYLVRNVLYFWFYEYPHRNIQTIVPKVYKVLMLTLNFILRPFSHWPQLSACLRGFRDGLLRKMQRRY